MNPTGALLATQDETASWPYDVYAAAPSSSTTVLTSPPASSTWRDDAERRIRDLRWLGPDWDGPGSPPVALQARSVALMLVGRLSIVEGHLRPPAITPTPFGGVFIEWHTDECSVAFTIEVDGKIEVCFDDVEAGLEGEEADPCRSELAAEWLPLLARHRA